MNKNNSSHFEFIKFFVFFSIILLFSGWLYDISGNYDITFVVAGVDFITGGFLLLLTKCFQKQTTIEKAQT